VLVSMRVVETRSLAQARYDVGLGSLYHHALDVSSIVAISCWGLDHLPCRARKVYFIHRLSSCQGSGSNSYAKFKKILPVS